MEKQHDTMYIIYAGSETPLQIQIQNFWGYTGEKLLTIEQFELNLTGDDWTRCCNLIGHEVPPRRLRVLLAAEGVTGAFLKDGKATGGMEYIPLQPVSEFIGMGPAIAAIASYQPQLTNWYPLHAETINLFVYLTDGNALYKLIDSFYSIKIRVSTNV